MAVKCYRCAQPRTLEKLFIDWLGDPCGICEECAHILREHLEGLPCENCGLGSKWRNEVEGFDECGLCGTPWKLGKAERCR